MQVAELVEAFSYKTFKRPTPHVLKPCFDACYIRPESIARSLGVSKETIRNWMAGRSIPPANHEKRLWELKMSLDRYEAKKGKKFDARIFVE
jgi:NOL1/NOP2/fmu family ribosome biogenesis protein